MTQYMYNFIDDHVAVWINQLDALLLRVQRIFIFIQAISQ